MKETWAYWATVVCWAFKSPFQNSFILRFKRIFFCLLKTKEEDEDEDEDEEEAEEKQKRVEMVLWEIALATAYFLGLKRTFKLALKTQQRLVSPKHPQIRQFLRGRTRAMFDVAVKVHQTIQRPDIKLSTNLGSSISRWLNQTKPSAETHEQPNATINTGMKMIKNVSNSYLKHRTSTRAVIGRKFDQYLSSTSSLHRWPKPFFPTIATIMRQRKLAGTVIQHRQFSICGSDGLKTNYRRRSFDHGIRDDIMQWMIRN